MRLINWNRFENMRVPKWQNRIRVPSSTSSKEQNTDRKTSHHDCNYGKWASTIEVSGAQRRRRASYHSNKYLLLNIFQSPILNTVMTQRQINQVNWSKSYLSSPLRQRRLHRKPSTPASSIIRSAVLTNNSYSETGFRNKMLRFSMRKIR